MATGLVRKASKVNGLSEQTFYVKQNFKVFERIRLYFNIYVIIGTHIVHHLRYCLKTRFKKSPLTLITRIIRKHIFTKYVQLSFPSNSMSIFMLVFYRYYKYFE